MTISWLKFDGNELGLFKRQVEALEVIAEQLKRLAREAETKPVLEELDRLTQPLDPSD